MVLSVFLEMLQRPKFYMDVIWFTHPLYLDVCQKQFFDLGTAKQVL